MKLVNNFVFIIVLLSFVGLSSATSFGYNYLSEVNSFEAINQVNKIGNPEQIDNLQEIYNHMYSAGVMRDCNITNNGDGTVNITEGYATLRDTNDSHATLYSVEVNAQNNIALTDNRTNYVYLDYNSGTPVFTVGLSITDFNCQDRCVGYIISREGNNLDILDVREQNVDSNRKWRRRALETGGFVHVLGGSVIGSSDLNISLTAGEFYYELTKTAHSAYDTSTGDTFDYYYTPDSGVSWVKTESSTYINNTHYNDPTTGLDELGNNKFKVDWVYVVNNEPSRLAVLYGQEEYAKLADAEAATIPGYLPASISGLGALVGRVILEKSSTTLTVESAFTQSFSASTPSTHNGLAGLQGGTVDQYYHFTNSEHTELTDWLGNVDLYSNGNISTNGNVTVDEFLTANNQHANKVRIGSLPGFPQFPAIFFGADAPNTTNYAFLYSTTETILNHAAQFSMAISNINQLVVTDGLVNIVNNATIGDGDDLLKVNGNINVTKSLIFGDNSGVSSGGKYGAFGGSDLFGNIMYAGNGSILDWVLFSSDESGGNVLATASGNNMGFGLHPSATTTIGANGNSFINIGSGHMNFTKKSNLIMPIEDSTFELNGNVTIGDTLFTDKIQSNTGNITFYNSTGSSTGRILENGWTGIRTNNPVAPLDVVGWSITIGADNTNQDVRGVTGVTLAGINGIGADGITPVGLLRMVGAANNAVQYGAAAIGGYGATAQQFSLYPNSTTNQDGVLPFWLGWMGGQPQAVVNINNHNTSFAVESQTAGVNTFFVDVSEDVVYVGGNLNVTQNLTIGDGDDYGLMDGDWNVTGLIYGDGSQLTNLPSSMDYTNLAMLNQSNDFQGNNLTNINYLQSTAFNNTGNAIIGETLEIGYIDGATGTDQYKSLVINHDSDNGGGFYVNSVDENNLFVALTGFDGGNQRIVYIGGGEWGVDAATSINFNVADAYTQTSERLVAFMDNVGLSVSHQGVSQEAARSTLYIRNNQDGTTPLIHINDLRNSAGDYLEMTNNGTTNINGNWTWETGNVDITKNLTIGDGDDMLQVNGDLNATGTIYADAINISNSSFSFTHDENNSIDFFMQNENSGSNASALIKTKNDVGGIFGIGITSSNYMLGSMFKPNMTSLFSRSQGEMEFINSYNQPFVWYNNPSDDNDVNNLVEVMRADETGLSVSGSLFVSAIGSISDFIDNIFVKNISIEEQIIISNSSDSGIMLNIGNPSYGWRDLLGEIRTRGVGASDPNDATYIGTIKGYSFDEGDEFWTNYHIPHDYKKGTDLYLHFHWSHNSVSVTGGSVNWSNDITYAKGHNQSAFSSTVSENIVCVASTTQYQHMICEEQLSTSGGSATMIDTDLIEPDGVIMIRGYLGANEITSSGAVPDPFLHFQDIHYKSTGIPTINKSPDFYT